LTTKTVAPLRVRLKLLDRIEAARKTTKEHLGNPGSILHCLPKIVDCVSCRGSKGTRLQRRETLAHDHVVPCSLLPVVLLQLRMYEGDELLLMLDQHVPGVFF
jgi:hypothetical protein